MKTISDLENIRQDVQNRLAREYKNRKIIVGMATCGIAAGAKPVMDALQDELNVRGIHETNVAMTGCIGVCQLEPSIEVIEPNGDKVTYVRMDASKARRVVAEHIVNGHICEDLTIQAASKE